MDLKRAGMWFLGGCMALLICSAIAAAVGLVIFVLGIKI